MLYIPQAYVVDSVTSYTNATRPVAAFGTSLTARAGTNSWVELISAANNPTGAVGFWMNFNSVAVSAVGRKLRFEIGFGASGSEVTMMDPMLISLPGTYITPNGCQFVYVPLRVPRGVRIAIRLTNDTANTTAIRAFMSLSRPVGLQAGTPGFNRILAGTATNVTPGTTTKSAWTSMGSTSTRNFKAVLIMCQVDGADAAHNAAGIHVDLAMGDGTNFTWVIRDHYLSTTAAEINVVANHLVTIPIPIGVTFYMRAQTSGTAEAITVQHYLCGD